MTTPTLPDLIYTAVERHSQTAFTWAGNSPKAYREADAAHRAAGIKEVAKLIAEQAHEPLWNSLDDSDRERAFNSMPDMLEGFMKKWGWLHFAKAIEAICQEKNPARQGVKQEPSEWMPIETAPKDGRTLLLGYFNSHQKWRTMRGQWMSEEHITENWEDPDYSPPGWYETVVEGDDIPNCWYTEPTHWMPLPPSPKP